MTEPDPQELEALAADLRRAVRSGTSDETGVPGFSILGVLGEGGQGTVLQAVQLSTGRRVALKVLRKGRMATALERMRFLREIRLAASLEHPDLVTVYEAGETDEGTPYLAMELVRGEPWDEWADRVRAEAGDEATGRILRAFAMLCDAVGHAHARGVLHRDLKPSNVLVEQPDRPRVLDLGLAYSLDLEESKDFRSRTSDFLGSLPWMPPERIDGRGAPVPASDVHALGLLLHRALTGRHAYSYGSSITGIVQGVASLPGSLEGPYSRDPATDRSCLAVLSQALDGRVEARHPDAAALAGDVRELAGGRVFRRPRRPGARLAAAAVVLAAAVLLFVAFTGGGGLFARGAEARLLSALDEVTGDGLAAWKTVFMTPTAVDATRDWTVPGPASTVLNPWRVAATHVYAQYPAERIVQLDPTRHWTMLRASGDGSMWLAMDDDRDLELVTSDGRSRPIPEQSTPFFGAGLSRDGRWCLLGSVDPPGLLTYRIGPDLELEGNRTLSADAFIGVADHEPWIAVRTTDPSTLRVIDLETRAVVIDVSLEDAPRHAVFAEDDRRLWIRKADDRWISLDTGDPSPTLVDAPEADGGQQVIPLPNGQLYVRDAVDHYVRDSGTGERRLLFAGSTVGRAVCVVGSEVASPSNHVVQRFRPARFSRALADWTHTEGWATRDIADLESLPATRQLALLRQPGEIVVLDPAARGIPELLSAGIRDDTFHEVTPTERGWLACRGGSLFLFDERGERSFEVCGSDETIYGFDFDGRGTVYFTTSAGRVGSAKVDGGRDVEWLYQHAADGSVVAISPDGRWLACADTRGELVLLPLQDAGPPQVLFAPSPDFEDRIPDLAWDAESRWILGGRRHTAGLLWGGPGREGSHSRSSGLGVARAVVYHAPSGEWVTGHDSGSVAIWTAGAEEPRERVEVASGHSIWALDFDSAGRFLAVGAGREVAVWDWVTKRRLFSSEAHDGLVFSLAFHAELPRLASAAEHGELFVWDFARVDDLAVAHPAR